MESNQSTQKDYSSKRQILPKYDLDQMIRDPENVDYKTAVRYDSLLDLEGERTQG
jgi:hypothetical protein